MRTACLALLVAATALASGACAAGRPRPATPGVSLSEAEADAVAIYATIVRRLCTGDDSFGGTHKPPVVYLVRRTDDSVGDPATPRGAPVVLPVVVQGGIVETLSDLPARLVWVDSSEVVPKDLVTGAVAGYGVIITLGNIAPQADGTVHVPASIYTASLAAAGQTYVLQKENGVWTVKGNTGVQWMS